MSGVLHQIKDWLTQDFGGRYIGVLLAKLAELDPESFSNIIAEAPKKGPFDWKPLCNEIRKRKITLTQNRFFAGINGRVRYADLAFVHQNNDPAIFIEVKEKDDFHEKQLRDYLFKAKRDVPFIHICMNAPAKPVERKAIEMARAKGRPVASIRYRDIYRSLQGRHHPFTEMVREYLEDIGVGVYQPVERHEEPTVAFLATQLLGATGQRRLTGRRTVTDLPKLLERMLNNLEFIAEWVREANRDLIGTSFTRKFYAQPAFDVKKLAKSLQTEIETDPNITNARLPDSGVSVRSGEITFASWGKLKTSSTKEWLYVEIGFVLCIDNAKIDKKNNKHGVEYYMYSLINGAKIKSEKTWYWTDYMRDFPDEKSALAYLRNRLLLSLAAARNNTVGITNAALQKFVVPAVA